jgi:soluble lytic murein transglycosylase-like protein
VTPPKIVPLPYDPDGKLHIELLPEKWEHGLRNFMTEAGALYKSAENRYKDGYYDAYRGDAADYAARYAASNEKLGSTAASLLKDIETLRPSYGNAWADEAASTVNSALLKFAGYGDTVRNDPAYWSQYKDEADYGAAMFKAGAESGAELRQMVDMKNKSTGLQAASYKPAQPEALSTRSTPTPSGAQKSASSSTQNYNNTFADPAILEAQKNYQNKIFKYNWGGKHVSVDFKSKVIDICNKLQMNPDDLMAIMAFESGGINPYAQNKSGATGLIQFMPSTARALGTSTDELVKMSAVDQLDYVYKYFKPYSGKIKNIGDAYMIVLMPPAVGKDDDFKIGIKDSKDCISGNLTYGAVYKANAGLDINKDGVITKGEAKQFVINAINQYT